MVGGHVWWGGVHGRGACMAGAMHGGGHAWGVHDRRCVWQGGMHGGAMCAMADSMGMGYSQ